ncbi:MAG: hypothetical protein R3E79_58040 [Caldilineaceae bacterium]
MLPFSRRDLGKRSGGLYAAVQRDFGTVDILVNSAGIMPII